MSTIELLNEETIDKIAAGEVVERPSSIVKELVENSIDAGATSITVEIKDGGISFIRITDNGCGIPKDQVKKAFFRHATSKLRDISDFDNLISLGFRGEALSSISAVSQVEIMTKTKDELLGTHYVIEGSVEKEFSEIGIPNGTTIIIRNVFFNTPVRRKFLKTSATEGSYINDICEHLALSSPNIAFKFINGGQLRFNTSGDGDLKEVVYRIYGKDIAKELIPVNHESKDISVNGFLGKPIINRSNRNFEKFFINGRYVKSQLLSNAVEDGYKQYLMQHKFPFLILNILIKSNAIDVNVHPTKMEIRFNNEDYIYDFIESTIKSTLKVNEMIPDVLLEEPVKEVSKNTSAKGPEPFENVRNTFLNTATIMSDDNNISEQNDSVFSIDFEKDIVEETISFSPVKLMGESKSSSEINNVIKAKDVVYAHNPVQLDLFEEKIISEKNLNKYRIIGQVFDTYWLFTYEDKMLILDQHAAHEKVKYEHIISALNNKEIYTQSLNPPLVISLTSLEKHTLNEYHNNFTSLGYEIDDFGGGEIAIRSVPLDLFGLNEKEVFLEILDELSVNSINKNIPEIINNKIASMACKSAVKGNSYMTEVEIKALLDELMALENPYNCPHGRPTIITMSKYEMDKKFKRIV